MTNTNITNLRKNLFEYIEQAVSYNDVINVSSKNGNAIIMSEQDYRNNMESLYITSVPGLEDEILSASKEPLSECPVYDENEEW